MTTKEIEKSFQEIWELFKETDLKFKETDRNFKETDRKIKETDRELKESGLRLEKEISALSKTVGALTGKWGRFVEGLLAPAIERLFRERGIIVEHVYQRARARRNGDDLEVDILASNGDYVVAIEAKSSLSVEDVKEHVERLEKLKEFFPAYKNHKVIGAVAGIVIEENADRYAYKSGLYVIGQSGDTVKMLNDEKFVPRVW